MKVTFLGTGTSMGVPIAGGFRRGPVSHDARDQRYRTSVWIQTKEASIVIDTGPEFRLQTLRAGIQKIDLLLLTHEHTDHIAGLDDLRPYCYVQKKPIKTFTSEQCMDAIRTRFHYMFEPNKTPGSVSLDFTELKEKIQFKDCEITPLPVKHGGMDVMGFRVNDFAYITDTNFIPEETKKRIEGAKVMVMSGLRWEPEHPTHYTIPEAVQVADKMGVPLTYLIHMAPYVYHSETEKKLPDHVRLSYDQLELEI